MRNWYKSMYLWSVLVTTLPTIAQEQKSIVEIIDTDISALAISPNGEWISGSAGGDCFIYNTQTKEFNLLESDFPGGVTNIKAVSSNGIQVGVYGADNRKAPAAYYKDGEWTYLPVPEDRKGTGSIAFTVSEDGTLIAGMIDGVTVGKIGLPCIWKWENGEYKVEILPYPETDITGSVPQHFAVTDMSADGSVLVGYMVDWTGGVFLLMEWTKGENGYEYKIWGEDIAYNLDEENCGVCPEYDDYVTVKQGEEGYEEQYAIWKPLADKYYSLREKFFTGSTFRYNSPIEISKDGRYISAAISKQLNDDPAEKPNIVDYPYRIDLKTDTESIYEEAPNLYSLGGVMEDGTIFATQGISGNAYVLENDNTAAVTLQEWIKQKTGADMPEKINFDGKITTGFPLASKDGSVIAGTVNIPQTFQYVNYYIQLVPHTISTTGVSEQLSVYIEKDQLHIEGTADEISLIDLTGKVVYNAPAMANTVNINFLLPGIYIAKLQAGGKTLTYKVIR